MVRCQDVLINQSARTKDRPMTRPTDMITIDTRGGVHHLYPSTNRAGDLTWVKIPGCHSDEQHIGMAEARIEFKCTDCGETFIDNLLDVDRNLMRAPICIECAG